MFLISAISYPLTALAAEGSEGGISSLGVNLKALILQIITFVIVFWLLKKFALDKIVKTLDERRQKIDDGVKLGLEMEAEKAKLAGQIRAQLQTARKEADEIIAKARQEASQAIKNAEEAAARKTEAMIADAHARLEDDVKKARQKLEQDMLDLVADATEVIIDEKLDVRKDNSLIERALEEAKSR